MNPAEPKSPPRLTWGARAVVSFVVFLIVFRGFDVMFPWGEWASALKVERMPRALPTRQDLMAMCEKADGSYEPVVNEFKDCGHSLARYWCPWPTAETRAHLEEPLDWGKYSLAWTATRLGWCEAVLGIYEEWEMFSPSTSTSAHPVRARLFFVDGTEVTVKQRWEPDDLTNYTRWNLGKNICLDRWVWSGSPARHEACPGYCNLLAHRHAVNGAGSPLREIQLYEVTFNFPPPAVDTQAYLEDVMAQTRDHHAPLASSSYYRYDPLSRRGAFLD